MVVVESRRRRLQAGRRWLRWLIFGFGAALLSAVVSTASGCGGYGSSSSGGTQRGTTTMMVTATSGSITHTANVSLTVQ